ncbi:hypothetical protein [Shewanella sp. YIC-542]|uniref:hypothetical protein n=1 Tax=Shewanella mytili TaxID=3377111 RepID=UPI00398EBE5F
MFLFVISLGFAIFFPLLKLNLTNYVTEYEYTLLVTVWSLSSLLGSQLIGSYPRLYPKDINNFKKITFDFFSVCISLLFFLIFVLYYRSFFATIMFFSCILILGVYELYSYLNSINRNYKGLFACEFANILPLLSIITCLSIFHSFDSISIVTSVYLLFGFLFFGFVIRKFSFSFKGFDWSDDYSRTKLALFFSQANAHLIPVIVGILYIPEVAAKLLVLYYLLSLPASLNQLLINRVMYSARNDSIKRLIAVIILVAIESIVLDIAFQYSLFERLIPYEFSLDFFAIFVFLQSRIFYTILFIRSRFLKVSGTVLNKFEVIRLCFMVLSLFAGKFFYFSYDAFLYYLSSSIVLFCFIFSIFIFKKNNLW